MKQLEMLYMLMQMNGVDPSNEQEVRDFLTFTFSIMGDSQDVVEDKVESILVMMGLEASTQVEYKEIFRLKEMLDKHQISYEFKNGMTGGYQLEYFHPVTHEFVCSVIETPMSYGSKDDLLEIMGLMTQQEMEETHNNVLGYLSADNVFERIYHHYTQVK